MMNLQKSSSALEASLDAIMALVNFQRDLAVYEREQQIKAAIAAFRQARADSSAQIYGQVTHYLHIVKCKKKTIEILKKRQPAERHFLFQEIVDTLSHWEDELRNLRNTSRP